MLYRVLVTLLVLLLGFVAVICLVLAVWCRGACVSDRYSRFR